MRIAHKNFLIPALKTSITGFNNVLVVDRGYAILQNYKSGRGLEQRCTISYRNHESNIQLKWPDMKIRWSVESANSRIIRWKALKKKMHNSQIPFTDGYVLSLCSLKCFLVTFVTYSDNDHVLAEIMVALAKTPQTYGESLSRKLGQENCGMEKIWAW